MYDASTLFAQLLNGLSYSSTLFLVASGLALIFGVTKIVNFAHGSFYMLGAYIALTVTNALPTTGFGFWGGVVIAALVVGAIGCLIEVTILRRIYQAPEVFQILVTFGLVLVFQNLIYEFWGPDEVLAPRVPGLKGAVTIFGERIPQYNIALIFVGPVFLGLLWWLTHRTRWGRLIRAATQDREMVASLGVNQKTLFTAVFFIGTFLAGLAGALQIPKESANLQMDINIVVEAFVIVVIGGMGSIMGAFLAAVLVGVINAFGVLFFPQAVSVLIFLVMVLVLVFRPNGLLGGRMVAQRPGDLSIDQPFRLPTRAMKQAMLAAVLALALLPLVLPLYFEVIMTEVFILAIFAGSLHFLLSVGGIVSFGHAAYFGLGSYAAALVATRLGLPMAAGVLAAMVAGAGGGLLFGWFCTRLKGVYLAMLTLAFAQILFTLSIQMVSVTGGDNGIVGLTRPSWLNSHMAYYYLALAAAVLATRLMRRALYAPFGFAFRAGRDSLARSAAIGIDTARIQWGAFVLSGAFAGLAGALMAYHRGSVFPTDFSVSTTVDALVMVLVGGVQSVSGPLIGALSYHFVSVELIRNLADYWRLILGLFIIVFVLGVPQGIVGAFMNRFGKGER
ncbi:ABC transporter permease [Rhodobacter sp. SGA-6-6]|uniref:ABC transporter permease n=1 Tax=Rhodobacter sp. SGA-6-6 TaxID=2710882 RepID=UPI0013EA71E4|nr:ABC transporter permease [Rhodobacter sp. SGA-6-6]NGM47086.1 ABC transporter permease [Rhodobacter sp. SGA-6-6]